MQRERARLVRLCAQLTGDPDAAEDLAQEAALLAHTQAGMLRDPERWAQWVAGIARNLCLHWLRRRAREHARELRPLSQVGGQVGDVLKPSSAADLADGYDVEVELERAELAALLDRALALLPPKTRRVLIERYVRELPQAEIALRLRMTEGAIEGRLHRGKLALRRVLTGQLQREAAAFGLAEGTPPAGVEAHEEWQETRIWCPLCGGRRLLGRFRASGAEFALRCPTCCAEPDVHVAHVAGAALLAPLRSFRPALWRVYAWAHDYYGHAATSDTVPCVACGHAIAVERRLPGRVPPSWRGRRGVFARCPRCGSQCWTTLHFLALALPEGRAFWRTHPRIRALPERELEVDGQAALVVSFESATGSERLDVLAGQRRYEVLGVYGGPPASAPRG